MRLHRLTVLLGSASMTALALAGSMLVAVPTAQASGAANADAKELVRLINGVRATSGLGALSIDTYLADKATGGAIPCPDNSSRTIAGRTRDFAAYGQMSHYLRLCNASGYKLSSTNFVTMLGRMGYNVARGEVLALNGGYGNTSHNFTYKSYSTTTYYTTAIAMRDWTGSSSHLAILMGSYNRVGCGAWAVGSTYYYACEFSRGGTGRVIAPPAQRKTSAPKPAGTVAATSTPSPTPSPSPSPSDSPTPSPTPSATDSPTPEATESLVNLAEAESLPPDPSWPPGNPALLVAAAALVLGGAGAGFYLLRHVVRKP
jgi:uncharacterized protein YkwD